MAASSVLTFSSSHALTCILCLFLTVAASVNAADDAFLLIHKKATIRKLKTGEEITVSFNIYNAGTVTAYDVSLVDSTWPSDVFDVEGNTTESWGKLEVGGKPLQHSFLLRSKVKGPFVSPPAVIKYRIASKPEFQVALSNPLPALDVLSDKPDASPFLWLKDLLVKFGPLASCSFIVIMFVIVVTTPTKPKKYSRGGKRR